MDSGKLASAYPPNTAVGSWLLQSSTGGLRMVGVWPNVATTILMILGPQPSDTGDGPSMDARADRVDLVVNGEVIGTQTPNHPGCLRLSSRKTRVRVTAFRSAVGASTTSKTISGLPG